MSKVKSFINRHKKALAVSAVSASLMVSSALSAFAADGDDTALASVKSAFSDGISTIKTQLLEYLVLSIGSIILVVGGYFCVRKAMSFFLKLTRKD